VALEGGCDWVEGRGVGLGGDGSLGLCKCYFCTLKEGGLDQDFLCCIVDVTVFGIL
jgi:hypothetical protein